MKTIIFAALLAFSATANAQGYGYNNDYARSMSNDEYQVYDRTQRQVQQSEMNRMHEENMRQQERAQQSADFARQQMDFDMMQRNRLR